MLRAALSFLSLMFATCFPTSLEQEQCTEVRFASFLSGGFITAIVVNPLERKLAKRTSVQCLEKVTNSRPSASSLHNLFSTLLSCSQELGKQVTHTSKNFSHRKSRQLCSNKILFIGYLRFLF